MVGLVVGSWAGAGLGSGCSAAIPPAPSALAADAGGPGDGASNPVILVGPSGARTFQPASITVSVGTTVQWFWSSAGHTVTSGLDGVPDNLFCSPNNASCATAPTSESGATFEHTFTKPGTFSYYCVPHVSDGMKGTVVVR